VRHEGTFKGRIRAEASGCILPVACRPASHVVQLVGIAHFREELTTDFTDLTDAKIPHAEFPLAFPIRVIRVIRGSMPLVAACRAVSHSSNFSHPVAGHAPSSHTLSESGPASLSLESRLLAPFWPNSVQVPVYEQLTTLAAAVQSRQIKAGRA
jgi:hypothetical protein